jgi:ribosome recycling factor
MNELMQECRGAMEKRLKAFENDLMRVRTGRASINLVDSVRVDYYGTPSPLNQVATLSTPDARTIVIAPFERTLIQEIERSIHKADLGLQPTNDGNVVRIPIPQLTEERRKEIAKSLKKLVEEAKIGVRQARKDANDDIKNEFKKKSITEDDVKKFEKDIQKVTDEFIVKIDERFSKKEKEILTV